MMMIGEIVRVALDSVVANKLRSLLTMLGVIIGIAAVIAMVALGEGAQQTVEDQLATLGTNVLTVRSGQQNFGGIDRGGNTLTVDDAYALIEDPQYLLAVAPEMESRYQIEFGVNNANLSTIGSWASYFDVNNFQIDSGRMYTDAEDRGRRRVAVLGGTVGEQLGGVPTQALIGQTVRIRGVPFEVIGVLAEKGSQGFSDPDASVFIPLATAQFRVAGTERIRSMGVKAVSAVDMNLAMAEIDQVLRREHRILPGEEADFSIRDQTSLLNTVQETAATFTFLLAGIAGISLLVGGIGIMNIMLVSVTERTREIGLRKSLGARKQDILFQFLFEALVLCVSGGILGLGLGAGASYLMRTMSGFQVGVSADAVFLAIGFSALVGVFFGLWPARRAANLAPIDALRWE